MKELKISAYDRDLSKRNITARSCISASIGPPPGLDAGDIDATRNLQQSAEACRSSCRPDYPRITCLRQLAVPRRETGKMSINLLCAPRGREADDDKTGMRRRRRHPLRLQVLAPSNALINRPMLWIVDEMKEPFRPDHVRGKLA
jgi:hypothetical protein